MPYEFGRFRLDPAERLLQRDSEVIPLTPRAFDTLVVLVEHGGHLVDKETLLRLVWKDTYVEESTLAQNVFTLRKALGESAGSRFIETVPKRGYRFVAPVTTVDRQPALPQPPAAPSAASRWKEPVVIALLAAVLLVASLRLVGRKDAESVAPPAASIAVLPFKSLTGDARDEYLGVAMADALTTRLSAIRSVTVLPAVTVRRFAGADPVAAGRELGVRTVLAGDIAREGERIRLRVGLSRVADGASLWSERFDVLSSDIFVVQDQVASRAARQLVGTLSPEEERQLLLRPTDDPRAYESYLEGRYFWNKRTEEGHVRAIEQFEEAVKLDVDFAHGWSGLADAYALLGSMPNNALPRAVAMTRAREAAVRAIEIDEMLAEAHTSLAFVKLHFEWDFEAAGRGFARAVELNPRYPTAHHWRAYYFLAVGDAEAAVASSRRAQELDPVSMIIRTDVAEMLYFARHFDESISEITRTLEMDPHFPLAHRLLALNLLEKGRFDEALAAGRRSIEDGREDQLSLVARIEARRGNLPAARAVLATLEEKYPQRFMLAGSTAAAYVAVGDHARALEMLEEALRQRDGGLILLRVDPAWDGLRSDERFVDLMRRVGVLR